MRQIVIILFGGGFAMCMLHRWKNVQVNCCFTVRARSLFGDALLRFLRKRFCPRSVAAAELGLEIANNAGDVNHSAASTVRGGKLLRWVEGDKDCKDLSAGSNRNLPLQEYLNHVFEAFKKSRRTLRFRCTPFLNILLCKKEP